MPCEHIHLPGTPAFPGGIDAIVCSRGRRPKEAKCSICGRSPAPRLCDFLIGGVARDGHTRACDRPLCTAHARRRFGHADEDYCPEHWAVMDDKDAREMDNVADIFNDSEKV